MPKDTIMTKKTFIRAIEFWVPGADGSLLEFGGGLFGATKRFEAATRNLCFGKGEGLPGQAWDCGHPLMLKTLEAPGFRRAAAAKADGLTCAVALPVFVGETLSAVVVLFCSDDADLAGAIELWHNEPEESSDMTLQSGHYGNTGDTFEFLSSHTSFRRGTGLPGRTWESQTPVFMPDLGRGSGFLRADSALKVGINRGFAMPCGSTNGHVYVLAFLSALATPFANQVDMWQPDALQSHLVHSFSFAEAQPDAALAVNEKLSLTDTIVGQVLGTGVPVLDGERIVMPVAMQNRMTAVLALSL
jgi:hypothetical protein